MLKGEARIAIEAIKKGTEVVMIGKGATMTDIEAGMMPTKAVQVLITTEEVMTGTEKVKKVTEGTIEVKEEATIVATKTIDNQEMKCGARTMKHLGLQI